MFPNMLGTTLHLNRRMFRECPKKSESDKAQIIDIIISSNNNNQSPIPANQELLAEQC